MNKLISLHKIKLSYNNNTIIDGLNLDICEQDFICIVGPNGSGKTTLLRGILGLIPHDSGEINYAIDHKQIGYIPQETTVDTAFPASAFEIVLSGALNSDKYFYSKATKQRAMETLDLLGIKHLKDRSFAELSGGQRQKVLIARALIATKQVLFLDEPSNSLDQKSKQALYKLLEKLNTEQKIAIIMVTHDLDHGNLIGNKILSLHDKNYFFGTTEEFVRRVHHE